MNLESDDPGVETRTDGSFEFIQFLDETSAPLDPHESPFFIEFPRA